MFDIPQQGLFSYNSEEVKPDSRATETLPRNLRIAGELRIRRTPDPAQKVSGRRQLQRIGLWRSLDTRILRIGAAPAKWGLAGAAKSGREALA